MGERPHTVAIGEVDIRTVLDQERHDVLMRRTAVREQDRFEQRRPAEFVHVVDVHIGLVQEVAHDRDMASLRCRDQRDAAIPVRDRRIGPSLVRDPQDVQETLATGVQHRVVERGVLRVHVRLGIGEHTQRIGVAATRREHGRRRPVSVAGIGRGAVRERLRQGRDVTGRRRGEETLIGLGRHRRSVAGRRYDDAVEDATRTRNDRVDLERIVALREFEAFARLAMEPGAFDYVAGGAWDEQTLAENEAAWRRFRIRPRILVDVSRVDTSTTLLGRPVSMPVAVAPMAVHGVAHPDGEIATARAAAAAGVPFALSTTSSRSIEEVAEAATDGRRWFQLYVQADPGRSRELVERAAAAGYEALILTVDLPRLGYRERDRRSGWELPPLGNFTSTPATHARGAHADGFEMLDAQQEVGLTWDDLATIRSWSSMPFVVKGILTEEDAVLALDHGVDAIVVSNHGARQLDRVAAGVDVLERIVEAVDGRVEVWVDGGVRRGIDVVIARALGAQGVLVGRPLMWALATDGEAGVARALAILREEFEVALTLLGTPTPAAITRDHVERPGSLPSGA